MMINQLSLSNGAPNHFNSAKHAILTLTLFLLTFPCHTSAALLQTSHQISMSTSNSLSITPPPIHLPHRSSPLHTIHIQPSFLTPTETSTTLTLAQEHAASTGAWSSKSSRHTSYNTVDFPIDDDSPSLRRYFDEIEFENRMLEAMSRAYDIDEERLSFLDLFCVRYNDDCRELRQHRDGGLLSFSVLLSDPSDFEGGGTVFDCLKGADIIPSDSDLLLSVGDGVICPAQAGSAVLHSGKMLHGGHGITSGERTILVGFVHVDDNIVGEGKLGLACRDWGRMDVATFRAKRQRKMGVNGGWRLRNARWLKKGGSWIRGYAPVFESVERRSEEDFQRRWNLKVEENFLEFALKDKKEWGPYVSDNDGSSGDFDLFGGDVTFIEN